MVYADRPWWIKVHGHAGVRFLDLVNGGRKPAGPEFVEAARRLAELAGVAFPELAPEEAERVRHAQAAGTGDLGLNNKSDTIEIRTLPVGLSGVGTTIFRLDYVNTVSTGGTSLTNLVDGQPILSNPATNADYRDHKSAPGAKGPVSPGRKIDDSPF